VGGLFDWGYGNMDEFRIEDGEPDELITWLLDHAGYTVISSEGCDWNFQRAAKVTGAQSVTIRANWLLQSDDGTLWLQERDDAIRFDFERRGTGRAFMGTTAMSPGPAQDYLRNLVEKIGNRWRVVPIAEPASSAVNVFRKNGDYFEIRYASGVARRVKSIDGMIYLAQLLAQPRRSFAAAELYAIASNNGIKSTALSTDDGEDFNVGASGFRDDAIDGKGRARLQTRLQELVQERADAEQRRDEAELARLTEETEKIEDYLRANTALGGKARPAIDDRDRVRKAVTNAITRARTSIRRHDKALADHLDKCVATGNDCEYQADVTWET
jgi:hypothetical protein